MPVVIAIDITNSVSLVEVGVDDISLTTYTSTGVVVS